MIDLIQHAALRVGIFQDGLAKGVERFQSDVLAPLADRFYYASLHLASGFVRKGQAQNVFTGKIWIGLQQVADALGNNAGFAHGIVTATSTHLIALVVRDFNPDLVILAVKLRMGGNVSNGVLIA